MRGVVARVIARAPRAQMLAPAAAAAAAPPRCSRRRLVRFAPAAAATPSSIVRASGVRATRADLHDPHLDYKG
jgi:hypothetical protein